MKKLKLVCFIGIAVLFALAMVTCDDFAPPETGGDGWDYSTLEPGEFFVGFNDGNGRSLTGPLAEAGADFFEVILVAELNVATGLDVGTTSGTRVFRTTFRDGRTGKMKAPYISTGTGLAADYSNIPVTGFGTNMFYAYIFAGRNTDKTLLGIGELTDVNGAPGTVINQDTRRVQFTVRPLTNDINANLNPPSGPTLPPLTPQTSTSTFRPWTSTTGGILGTPSDNTVAKIMIDGSPAPIFLIPSAVPGATQGLTNVQYDILTNYAGIVVVNDPASSVALVQNPAVPKVISRGYIWDDADYAPISVPASITNLIAGTVVPTINPLPTPTGLRLLLSIDTHQAWVNPPANTILATSGLGRISIEVPVVMFTDEQSQNQTLDEFKDAIVWYLRGGINNALIEQGKDFNDGRGSLGGAILIGVGDVLTGGGFVVSQRPQP
jgi:hypothetical protein